MKGLVVGCSLACGYCASDARARIKTSWPQLLMEYIGITDVYNKSLPGLSNKGIVRNITDFLEQTDEEIFVIISVTSDMRSLYDVADNDYTIDYTYGNHMQTTPGAITALLRHKDNEPNKAVYVDKGTPDFVEESYNVVGLKEAHCDNYIVPSVCETPAYMTYISAYLKEKQIKHLFVNAASVQYDNIITSNKINSQSFKDFAVPPMAADGLHPDVTQNREFFNLIKDQVRSRYDFRN